MTENKRMSICGLLDVLDTGISLSTCHMEYSIQGDVLEDLVKCLEELEHYRAIGTVKGYERAIQSSIENYNLYREYKAKVQEYEEIGTVEEFKALKKNEPKGITGEWIFKNDGAYGKRRAYCSACGKRSGIGGIESNQKK